MKKCLYFVLSLSLAILVMSCSRTYGEPVTYELKPHGELPVSDIEGFTKIFLAGTIDMGSSVDWQAQLKEHFASKDGRYVLFNPRQDHWNGGADGEMDYQVNWELDHLEKADWIIMNFLPGSRSPITLLELGLHARGGRLLVICPPGFYRYDNVRITCGRYGVPMLDSLEDAVRHIGQNGRPRGNQHL